MPFVDGVLAADLGATHCRLAVTDLAGTLVAERTADLDIAVGPEQVLGWLEDELCDLVRTSGHDLREVRGLGVGLPGPVEHGTGRLVNPPIMPGWDGYGVIERLQQQFAMPVLVDNDVNIMALGEHHVARSELRHLMFVKVGTGIGSGLISEGRLHRGAQGAAGDIGHIRLAHADDVVCRCGNVDCLEAVAGGGALADRLRRAGHEARTARDVVRLATSGNAEAVRLLRQAGRDLGEVLAATVSMVNPDAIVVGGDLAETGDQLLAGVREVVYRRSLPLATQHLSVLPSQLGDRAGVVGAATMVVDHVLSPDVLATAFSAGR